MLKDEPGMSTLPNVFGPVIEKLQELQDRIEALEPKAKKESAKEPAKAAKK